MTRLYQLVSIEWGFEFLTEVRREGTHTIIRHLAYRWKGDPQRTSSWIRLRGYSKDLGEFFSPQDKIRPVSREEAIGILLRTIQFRDISKDAGSREE